MVFDFNEGERGEFGMTLINLIQIPPFLELVFENYNEEIPFYTPPLRF